MAKKNNKEEIIVPSSSPLYNRIYTDKFGNVFPDLMNEKVRKEHYAFIQLMRSYCVALGHKMDEKRFKNAESFVKGLAFRVSEMEAMNNWDEVRERTDHLLAFIKQHGEEMGVDMDKEHSCDNCK
jgi:hypothetical protein